MAHVITAFLTVFFLSQIGQAVALVLPVRSAGKILLGAAVAGVVVDLSAILRGSMSVGFRRQTAKSLAHTSDTWWVTPLLWGADTGIIGTTYRVSFTSWLLLLSAILGAAPAWSGAVYGLCFAVPLIVSAALGKRAVDRWHGVQYAQALGVVVMVAASGWMVVAWPR
ncbi:hypothetical protein [Nonomuraea typhae]|uniref:Sulfite exporter TauE/SafE family protein n=1 Tax=Nonomuraea typhae TaxID=2603600 RepID=A0ABW7YMY3_9ACTN